MSSKTFSIEIPELLKEFGQLILELRFPGPSASIVVDLKDFLNIVLLVILVLVSCSNLVNYTYFPL